MKTVCKNCWHNKDEHSESGCTHLHGRYFRRKCGCKNFAATYKDMDQAERARRGWMNKIGA